MTAAELRDLLQTIYRRSPYDRRMAEALAVALNKNPRIVRYWIAGKLLIRPEDADRIMDYADRMALILVSADK